VFIDVFIVVIDMFIVVVVMVMLVLYRSLQIYDIYIIYLRGCVGVANATPIGCKYIS